MNYVKNGQAGFARTSVDVLTNNTIAKAQKHVLPTQNNSPYQLGKDAFRDGLGRDDNPFHSGDAAEEWTIGFEGASIAATTENECFA